MAAFAALVAVVQEGDWGEQGWKGSNIGFFYGGPTIQVSFSCCCYYWQSCCMTLSSVSALLLALVTYKAHRS